MHKVIQDGVRHSLHVYQKTTSSLPQKASSAGKDRRFCAFNSFRLVAALAIVRHFGSAGLSDHPALSAQEEKAKGQSDQPENPKGKP